MRTKDFSDYTGEITFTCCEKSDVAPFTGTIYRETAADAGKGELWIKGYDATATSINDAWKGNGTSGTRLCDTDAPLQLKAIRLSNHALLAIPSNVVVETDSIISVNDAAYTNRIQLVGGSLKLKSGTEIEDVRIVIHHPCGTDGGELAFTSADPQTLTIGAGGDLVIDTPYTAHGDVHVKAGGVIRHTRGNGLYALDLTVPGDLTIDAGGGVDVTGCGWEGNSSGPGASGVGGAGASHGGRGSGGSGSTKYNGGTGACYGSIRYPVANGSGGRWVNKTYNSYGGGSLKLTVSGTIANNGRISADGDVAQYYSGSGGSAWVTAKQLTGAGSISANGGPITTGQWYAAGGGGRVAVYISDAANDFSGFSGTITATGGGKGGVAWAAAGTVYLKSGADADNGGRLLIDNGTSPQFSQGWTRIDTDVTDTDVGTVEIGAKTTLVISDGKSVTVGKSWTNRGAFTADPGSSVVLAPLGASVTVSGTNDFYNLTALAPAKSILFGLPADTATAILEGGTVTLKGEEGSPLTLDSTDGESQWKITADPNAIQALEYLTVNNSDASVGAMMVAETSTGTNCQNWNFVNVVVGETITWQGTSSSSWSDAANWDLSRVPKETDNIVIAAGGLSPDAVADIEAWSLTVESGAELELKGYALAVTNLTVTGSLVCDASETITVKGSAAFASDAFTAANSTVTFLGADDCTFAAGGNTFDDLVLNREGGTLTVSGGFTATRLYARTDNGAYTLTVASGSTIAAKEARFLGDRGGVAALTLRSTVQGGLWHIDVTDYAVAGGVNVTDSYADGLSISISHPGSCSGCTGWSMGGASCVWTGAEDNDFHNGANWAGGAAPGATDSVSFENAATVTATGAVTLANLDLGGGDDTVTFTLDAPLTVSGSVLVGENATLALNRGATIGNALIVADGGVVTHSANTKALLNAGTTNALYLTVNGNLTVNAGGAIDVIGKGYPKGVGPGAKGVSQAGPSYGGRGGTTGGASSRVVASYGSVFRPDDLGSGGTDSTNFGTPGGGAARLVIGGLLRVDGAIDADGADDITPQAASGESGYYSGSGGSLWITVGSLTGSGAITANGGLDKHGFTGGGGRIAVYLTTADAIAFTGTLEAHGGGMETLDMDVYAHAGAGTVYVQGAATADGYGTLTIDNCRPYYNYYSESHHITDLPVTNACGETARDLKNLTLKLANYAVLNLVADLEVAELEVETRAKIRLNGHTLTVVSRKHKNASKSAGWDWPLDVNGTGAILFKRHGLMVIVR